ncbi:putative quinol monooxygenase [Lactobacillus kalixensis]|uniref:Antibiotic biosynthesis monooxygenase n=1 Tax=Lactobacillus kalixensis DSM 16043 TaxID=1423763 RepID=A0A0R1U8K2_9LACO|nr:antibiotic biosynthesis monooxygenase [Lactobacillus kalixensis]KRL89616.1 antibiotic biosynthesis monooxygenase [Lactobacillus kalixensis DSM 16043]
MKLNDSTILRFFHLNIDAKDVARFQEVGKKNMTTSIKKEPGTLFMALTNDDSPKTSNYVLECYRDESSYEIHASSPQFKEFSNVAKNTVIGREVFELTPQIILTKDEPLRVAGQNDYYVRILKLTLVDEDLKKFGAALREEVSQSMEKVPGLKGVLAGNFFDVENEWRIFEIFDSKVAAKQYSQSSQYANFEKQVHDMIYSREAIDLNPDIIVDQGKLEY